MCPRPCGTPTSSGALTFRPASRPASNLRGRCRNINLPSIDYAFGPRLRVRLTLGGFTFPRTPAAFGERDSHPFYRYSFRHDPSQNLQGSLSVRLRRLLRRPPTVAYLRMLPAASVLRL